RPAISSSGQSAPFTRTSGPRAATSARGVSSSKTITWSTAARPASTSARSSAHRIGRPGPFSRRTEASPFSPTTSTSPSARAAAVGGSGLAAEELAGLEPELARVRDELAARRAAGTLAFAELPHRFDDARRVLDDAAGVGADIDVLVVLGIGGSALGARALVSALGERPGGRRVIVADSIDPDDFGALLGQLDARRTLFNVISK